MKIANPQGKGLVPLLGIWSALDPVLSIAAKSERSILQDYIAGLLILSAEIRFSPVVGREYFLYLQAGRWRVSMISPAQWYGRPDTHFAGTCTLRPDACWDFEADPALGSNPELAASLAHFQENVLALVDTERPFTELLPFYESTLPFYPRLMATALAKSLQLSVHQIDQPGISGAALLGPSPAVALRRLLDPASVELASH